jgi:hypothetical protein
MKRIWIILAIALLQQIAVSAQDLVVTTEGDSLNCKITKIKGGYVYFAFSHQNEVRNTLLPQTQVKYHQYNYYAAPEVLPFQIAGYQPEFQHWRLAFNAGWSRRLAPLPDGLTSQQKEYAGKLKNGFNISADAGYFFTEMFGVGLKYDLFKTSNSSSVGEDNISITFVGPAFAMRFYNRSKTNSWYMDLELGYMGYKDQGKKLGNPVTFKGSTFGAVWNIGYDFAISGNWAAGIQLSFLSGMLTECELTENGVTRKIELEKDEYEGLGRMNISIGLRYNL